MYTRITDPDTAYWGTTEHLLARAVEALEAANWQRSGDDKAPRPKQIIRPGVVDEEKLKKQKIEERLAARGIIVKKH